eukprot:4925402-Alexandrium_andersonii.AAC.1
MVAQSAPVATVIAGSPLAVLAMQPCLCARELGVCRGVHRPVFGLNGCQRRVVHYPASVDQRLAYNSK